MTTMMKRSTTAILVTAFFAAAQSAGAQTRVYVAGDLFAEMSRMSHTTITPELIDASPAILTPDDGVTVGGGGRIGAFFSPVWSLELGVDLGKANEAEQTRSIGSPSGPFIPPALLQYTSRTSQQFTAVSVLVGYHPVARGRIQPGFRGGVSFMRSERQFTIASIGSLTFTPTLPGGGILVPRISVLTNQYETVTNGLTATVAAEAAIELFDRFAIVPEMRVHAGGIGGILLRPGMAVRWRW